jgi:hypothetical protein
MQAGLDICYIYKGQIKPKDDWRAVGSPKKQTNKFVFFCREKQKKQKKKIVRSMARQSAYGFS